MMTFPVFTGNETTQNVERRTVSNAERRTSYLQFLPIIQRALYGEGVYVDYVAADGDAGGYAGDPDIVGFEDLRDVMGGGVAFNVGVGRDDDLGDALADDPVAKLIYPDIVGADAFEGVDDPVKDMIAQLPRV